MTGKPEVIDSSVGLVPTNASALSDARFGKVVEAGAVLCARSIKPLEGSRPWLRRTRALWRLNGGRQRVSSVAEAVW